MGATKIEWAEAVWNPVTGCTPISAGCEHCYARRMAQRLAGRNGYPKKDPFNVTVHYDRLQEPQHWKKPRRIFVCSMGDLFHSHVSEQVIFQVFSTMMDCPWHTYLILTKRPERMKRILNRSYWWGRTAIPIPQNIWLGVTVENQEQAEARISWLLETLAAVRFVSYEPALGAADFRFALANLNWVICGGETGPGARPMHPAWARGVRDQCQAAGVPFFFKGWGDWAPRCGNLYGSGNDYTILDPDCKKWACVRFGENGRNTRDLANMIGAGEEIYMQRVSKRRAGRLLDGVEHNAMPKGARG